VSVEVRAASEEEVPEIVGLLDVYAQRILGEREIDEEELRSWFRLPRVWIRVAERDGEIAGYVDALQPGDDGVHYLYLRTLDADSARALLRAVEEHVGTGVIRPVSPSEDSSSASVLHDEGWRPVRHTFQMQIDLDGYLSEPAWPEGIGVRTFRPGEEQRVYEANNAAFAQDFYFEPKPFDDWRTVHIDAPRFDPALWWLAEHDGELVGFSRNAWHFSGDPSFGWIESLGVLPAWRRRGLATALLRHSFRDFRGRGATRVGLGVDAENATGAVALYERVGMRIHRRSDTYEKRL
jgi:mycothiol synthase